MESPFPLPSQDTLDRAPARVLSFVQGVSRHQRIRASLARRGYDDADHQEALDMLAKLLKLPPVVALPENARQAMQELDAWDETNFDIIFKSLKQKHPAQAAFVMQGLTASTGLEAVLGVGLLLERLDALESAPERAETRAQDAAALETLAKRGIDASERARVRALYQIATSLPSAPDLHAIQEARQEEIQQTLVSMHAWWEAWSSIARSLIKHRNHLRWLGLASASSSSADPDPDPNP